MTDRDERVSDSRAGGAQIHGDGRTWIVSPLSRDLAGFLAWTFVVVSVFYIALVGSLFGESGLWNYILVIPATLVFVGVVGPFTFIPVLTARRIGVGTEGLAIVRLRNVDAYPWSGVKPGFRPPRIWPFIGQRYPIDLSGSPNTQPQAVGLTRAQAELIAAHFGKTVEETWLPRKNAKQPK